MSPSLHPTSTSSATPATAVEVVTQLGNAVVATDHISLPTKRKSAMLPAVAGAGLLAIAASLALYSLAVASSDNSAKAAWLAAKKPLWAFRPELVPLWFDYAMIASAAMGAALVVLAVFRRSAPVAKSSFTLGTTGDLPIDGLATREVIVASPHGLSFALSGLQGAVQRNGTTFSSGDCPTFVANIGDRASLQLGATTLHMTGVDAAVTRLGTARLGADGKRMAYLGAAAAFHIALLFTAWSLGNDGRVSGTDGDDREDLRMVALPENAFEEAPPPPPEDGDGANEGVGSEAPNAVQLKVNKVTGADGGNDAKKPPGAIGNDGSANDARTEARQSGILAALDTGRIAGLIGDTAVMDGMSDSSLYGGLLDGEGAAGGQFGSRVGGGGGLFGGPGTGIRVGGFQTIGNGKNAGDDWRPGGGHGPGGGRKPAVPEVGFRPITTEGDYDKSLIRTAMKFNHTKISFCYESQLLKHPELAGTVALEFALMTSNGKVMSSHASGVSSEVANCIANVVSNIVFPSRAGGQIVTVRYPITLRVNRS